MQAGRCSKTRLVRASTARWRVSPAPGGTCRRFASRTAGRTHRNAWLRAHRAPARCRHDRVKRRTPLCPVHSSPLSAIAPPLTMPHLSMVVSSLRSPVTTHAIQRPWRLAPRPRVHDRYCHRDFSRAPFFGRPALSGPVPISSMRPVAKRGSCAARKCERERIGTALTQAQAFRIVFYDGRMTANARR